MILLSESLFGGAQCGHEDTAAEKRDDPGIVSA
jgi:hypothetical protein